MSRLALGPSVVREVALNRENRECPECGEKMYVRCRRKRCILTLDGPVRLSIAQVQCHSGSCDHSKLLGSEKEASFAMPRWGIGWDVFCWIGQRRFSRHWSVPQIRHELADSYDIKVSDDAIEDHLASYQNMVAARHQDPQVMGDIYADSNEVVLTIDGLQPEKGHETLYVVREVTRNRVWFAEALLSGATDEIRKLFVRAKSIADKNLKVVLWISDKQEAFLKCIEQEFPDVPHRYCENHFFRDLAKPVLEMDSTAKKKMRAKIRGLRSLEREVLDARQAAAKAETVPGDDADNVRELLGVDGEVVLDFCSVVRGILNDNHGGPYHPPGLRMLDALADVQESLDRIASSQRTGRAFSLLNRLKGFIDRGVADEKDVFDRVREYTDQVRAVMDILAVPVGQSRSDREPLFSSKVGEFQRSLDDKIHAHFSKVMSSFQVGLFAGSNLNMHPNDNLALERWFRIPKSHERRIHGHHHAGIRIARDGPTLIPTLDAHLHHPAVFTREDLSPFESAVPPPDHAAAQQRNRIMRTSRSKKTNNFPERTGTANPKSQRLSGSLLKKRRGWPPAPIAA